MSEFSHNCNLCGNENKNSLIADNLKKCYKETLLPIELDFYYGDFHQSPMDDAYFCAKPIIILVGQYSTGKTTFIKSLLNEEYPEMRIGPEPTTDNFIILTDGPSKKVIPGNVLVNDPQFQFQQLKKYGAKFLSRLKYVQLPNIILQRFHIIDTPGILSADNNRKLNRGYDFKSVINWFAERVDKIILFFDSNKLDISDEFQKLMKSLSLFDEKVIIILNKSDQVNSQHLMRVYGALMWSLGKDFITPEVARVYIGTFWKKPFLYDENRKLFELEANDLYKNLNNLAANLLLNKTNYLLKRIRMVKIHSCIISYLKIRMCLIGKEAKKKCLINDLDFIFDKIEVEQGIPHNDMPNIDYYRSKLRKYNFSLFKTINKKNIELMNHLEDVAIPLILQQIGVISDNCCKLHYSKCFTPFDNDSENSINVGRGFEEWIVEERKQEYLEIFDKLRPVQGKINGEKARLEMLKTKLPKDQLQRIWVLSDIDKDNMLDEDEFCLAVYLMEIACKADEPLPSILPRHLIPPSKLRIYMYSGHCYNCNHFNYQ